MELKVKRLTDTAILPTFGDSESAGIDLYADLQGKDELYIKIGETVMIH